jgi:CubicO group peptidase (beta-lactamase class C family)
MKRLLLLNFVFLYFSGNLLSLNDTIVIEEKNDSIPESVYQLVLLKNKDEIIPFTGLEESWFSCFIAGELSYFGDRMRDYQEMDVDSFPLDSILEKRLLRESENKKKRLVLGINSDCDDASLRSSVTDFVKEHPTVVVFFGSPEDLGEWDGLSSAEVLLLSEKNDSICQDHAAQALFGGIGIQGKLQKEIPGMYAKGHGIETQGGLRFEYTQPDSLGLNGDRLNERIDSVVNQAIGQKAFPGCQILMAVNGKVILRKSYGYHTYDKKQKVQNADLYDLASVTKISGPLPLLMQLNGAGVLDLDRPFSDYWSDWKNRLFHCSNKDTLTLRQILAHQARLVPYLGFWRETKHDGSFKRRFYRLEASPKFPYEVGEHLYLKERFKNKIYRLIRRSDLLPEAEYRYSGLSFLVYPEMISQMTGISYEELLYSEVYRPLGATRLVYNPLNKGFSQRNIPPTEVDLFYRESQVHGRVHDEAAAVLGGVSGNAGLFGNANDLGKLMQMYLNMGQYGGQQIIPHSVVEEFIAVQYPENENRRGLGFDKPLLDNKETDSDAAYPARGASQSSFGHSGFTGTFVWMDPASRVLYIFLSNRVFPTRENVALYDLNVRTSIQQILYDALEEAY